MFSNICYHVVSWCNADHLVQCFILNSAFIISIQLHLYWKKHKPLDKQGQTIEFVEKTMINPTVHEFLGDFRHSLDSGAPRRGVVQRRSLGFNILSFWIPPSSSTSTEQWVHLISWTQPLRGGCSWQRLSGCLLCFSLLNPGWGSVEFPRRCSLGCCSTADSPVFIIIIFSCS